MNTTIVEYIPPSSEEDKKLSVQKVERKSDDELRLETIMTLPKQEDIFLVCQICQEQIGCKNEDLMEHAMKHQQDNDTGDPGQDNDPQKITEQSGKQGVETTVINISSKSPSCLSDSRSHSVDSNDSGIVLSISSDYEYRVQQQVKTKIAVTKTIVPDVQTGPLMTREMSMGRGHVQQKESTSVIMNLNNFQRDTPHPQEPSFKVPYNNNNSNPYLSQQYTPDPNFNFDLFQPPRSHVPTPMPTTSHANYYHPYNRNSQSMSQSQLNYQQISTHPFITPEHYKAPPAYSSHLFTTNNPIHQMHQMSMQQFQNHSPHPNYPQNHHHPHQFQNMMNNLPTYSPAPQHIPNHIQPTLNSASNNVRYYNCDLCSHAFLSSRQLLEHRGSYHKIDVTKLQQLFCSKCNKNYSSSRSLKAHMDRYHSSVPVLFNQTQQTNHQINNQIRGACHCPQCASGQMS